MLSTAYFYVLFIYLNYNLIYIFFYIEVYNIRAPGLTAGACVSSSVSIIYEI